MFKKITVCALSATLLLIGTSSQPTEAAYGGKVTLKNTYSQAMPVSQMYGRSGLDVHSVSSSAKITFKGETYSKNTVGKPFAYATTSLYNSKNTKVASISKSISGGTSASAVASKQVSVSRGKYKVSTSHTVEIFNSYGKVPNSTYRGSSSYSTSF
ncbi:hypothetical protein [Listeria booriae]|uniref:hypothetical protein n=1 Tax=Listeria booriae TaxID=1552123 RepID=UPI00162A52DE|nr:hypothetical protein [Listeria booriae]MBC2163780.1 hypothetical protein [Listeria booriae]